LEGAAGAVECGGWPPL